MLDNKHFYRSNRLRNKAEIQEVFAKRERITSAYYTLYYRLKDEKTPRLGLIAAKRNIRLAVTRNRLKRIAREVFRIKKASIASVDIVLVIQKQAASVTNQELHQCLNKLFNQLSARLEKV